MTNNQLTKEWLQNRIADMESTRDDIPFGFDESGNNELAAFKLALAAMDSEPVAIIDQANLDYLRSGADADVWPPEREEMGDVLLYRHPQPAPVVPDGSKEALSEAVAAIYFTDSTDYLPALYSVVNALSPEVFAQLLNNEKAAFDATRLPAAPQEVKGE